MSVGSRWSRRFPIGMRCCMSGVLSAECGFKFLDEMNLLMSYILMHV